MRRGCRKQYRGGVLSWINQRRLRGSSHTLEGCFAFSSVAVRGDGGGVHGTGTELASQGAPNVKANVGVGVSGLYGNIREVVY